MTNWSDWNWYGGEPLLAKEIIWSLSEKFLEFCATKAIDYDAFIITNASLLEDSDVELFKRNTRFAVRKSQSTASKKSRDVVQSRAKALSTS
ncbi:MAG: hypothetical protein IJG32_00790 [Selenomonadaceae bacterium]|nr:hypothetical protein [Selenomonadaceae bacterium]